MKMFDTPSRFLWNNLEEFQNAGLRNIFWQNGCQTTARTQNSTPKNSQNAPDKSLACPSNGWFAAFFFSAYFQTSMILKKILSVKSGRRLFLTVRWSGETLSSNMWKGRSTAIGSLWWGQTHQPNSRGVYIIHHKYYHYIYIYISHYILYWPFF